uniref:Uncharacterized protein n=1 Tax=Oryza punctata TaxID=4537 RepID=A0A0E0LUB8_ORYPU
MEEEDDTVAVDGGGQRAAAPSQVRRCSSEPRATTDDCFMSYICISCSMWLAAGDWVESAGDGDVGGWDQMENSTE